MINPTNTPIKKNVMIPPLSFSILSPFITMILEINHQPKLQAQLLDVAIHPAL